MHFEHGAGKVGRVCIAGDKRRPRAQAHAQRRVLKLIFHVHNGIVPPVVNLFGVLNSGQGA